MQSNSFSQIFDEFWRLNTKSAQHLGTKLLYREKLSALHVLGNFLLSAWAATKLGETT